MRGSDFPADTAMAKAWGGIGNILVELGRRKQAADDALATSEAAQLRDLADNQMQLYMETEPDPNKWGSQWSKILGQVDKKHAKLKFSNNVRERESLRQAAFRESSELKLQIDVTRQTVENAVIDTGRNYQIAFESGDEMKIAEAKTAYSDALNLRYAPKIAKIHLDKATAEGMKAREVAMAITQADTIYAELSGLPFSDALDALNEIKGLSESVRSSIEARIANKKQINEIRLETAREDDRNNITTLIRSGDYAKARETIEASNLDEKEQTLKLDRLDKAISLALKGTDVVSNRSVVVNLKHIARQIDDRTITYRQIRDQVEKNFVNGIIDRTDADAIMAAAEVSLDAGKRAAEIAAYRTGVRQIVGQEAAAKLGSSLNIEVVAQQIAALSSTVQLPGEKRRWQLFEDYLEDYMKWVKDNPDDVRGAYQMKESLATKYSGIVAEGDAAIQTFLSSKRRAYRELSETHGKTKAYKKGDTKTINGVTYTFNGKDWNY